MPRQLVATIHSSALRHNLGVVRQSVPKARIWGVVKANAYGHGLARGMRAFDAADGLALIEVEGAAALREHGWKKPVLLLEGFFEASDVPLLAQHSIDAAVHCNEQIDMIARSGIASPINVHLKLNSGMNRLGFTPAQFSDAYARLRALKQVGRISFMTHFANADEPNNAGMPLAEQARRFRDATEGLSGERSLSNSAAVLLHPELAADFEKTYREARRQRDAASATDRARLERKLEESTRKLDRLAHAIANGVYVAGVNRVGHENGDILGNRVEGPGLEFWGGSFLADPFGRIVAKASHDAEEVLLGEIDLGLIEETRRNWPFLRDRRIDAYAPIAKRFLDDAIVEPK